MTGLRLPLVAVLLAILVLNARAVWARDPVEPARRGIDSTGPVLLSQAAQVPPNASFRDIAPVRLFSVPDVPVIQPQALPDPVSMPDEGMGIGERALEYFLPATSPEPAIDWSYVSDGAASSSGRGVGRRVTRKRNSRASSLTFSSLNATDTWQLGTDNWRYSRSGGLDLTLGHDSSRAPGWGSTARLGGVGISKSFTDRKAAEDEWEYSVMVGALDYLPNNATQGGLVYGPAASDTVVRYGLSPQLTLESQVQWAPDLITAGLGGQYKTRYWGAWEAGVAKASQDLYDGWRYRVGYEVRVLDSLQLSWVNEQRSGGFSDLNRYKDFSLDTGRSRNAWMAKLALGRWGDLSGSFEQVQSASRPLTQQFGLAQQFWYSPNLRVSLKAERELISGDYLVGLRFALPID